MSPDYRSGSHRWRKPKLDKLPVEDPVPPRLRGPLFHNSLGTREAGTNCATSSTGTDAIQVRLPQGQGLEEAGIESGDIVIAVDGASVQGKDIVEVNEKLEGPQGKRVGLSVLRDEEEREFSVERAEIDVPATSWNLIPGTDAAHLKLVSFSDNSAAELDEAIGEA